MFSEILKIIPKLDQKDLDAMQKALQSRFTKIAKGFGKGLANVFKGGGVLGIALGLLDKLLNPLKETNEAIDRMLKSSDDIATNATQFNTSAGKLYKLITLAKATGLDQDTLFMQMQKFATARAEAIADPSKPSAVQNFTQGDDVAQSFFEFIQSLQKMDRNQQLLVQQQVFGEKQILKMADFLQTDFSKAAQTLGFDKVSTDKLSGSIEKLATLNDTADALTARREMMDMVAKSGVINGGMITARDKSAQLELQRENQRIKSYNDLAAISQTTDKIMMLVEQGIGMIGALINKLTPFVDKVSTAIDALMKSPFIRGVKSWFGKGD